MQMKETKRYVGDNDARMEFADALEWAKQHGAIVKRELTSYKTSYIGVRMVLQKDLYVFKAVLGPYKGFWTPRDPRIANLIIPAGEEIVLCKTGDYHKCRATKAFVHSIVSKETHTKCKRAVSGHNMAFEYRVGRSVAPTGPAFSPVIEACASGIHFYMDVQSAHCHHA